MIGKLIVSHGGLAKELLLATRSIAGDLHGFDALTLDWSQGFDEARSEIEARLRPLDQGKGVLILTTMFGDTPANASLSLVEPGRVEIVAGVNLPMVVRLACMPVEAMTLPELVQWIAGKGKTSIRCVSTRPSSGTQSPTPPKLEAKTR